jgi:hypothetical protein|tara:strand:+ start:10570 stop:10752 length:183 start_codon:yes stop_codon:yes gene_type:complete
MVCRHDTFTTFIMMVSGSRVQSNANKFSRRRVLHALRAVIADRADPQTRTDFRGGRVFVV